MKRKGRAAVEINSRDYWLKSLENHQTNWALIDEEAVDGMCTALFIHELSGVFDRIFFRSRPEAEIALRFNGFGRLAEWADAPADLAPPPPFFEDEHPNGPIYSSGQYWRQPPDPGDTAT